MKNNIHKTGILFKNCIHEKYVLNLLKRIYSKTYLYSSRTQTFEISAMKKLSSLDIHW